MHIPARFKKLSIKRSLRTLFWFGFGGFLGLFFFLSFLFLYYQKTYDNKIYPGIFIDNQDFGGKSPAEVEQYFEQKNTQIQDTQFILIAEEQTASLSAQELQLGYNSKLLSQQAFSIGRSENFISDVSILAQAYTNGILLPTSYSYDDVVLKNTISPLQKAINKKPIDALFTFENGRVTAFKPSSDGKSLDANTAQGLILAQTPKLAKASAPKLVEIELPVKTIEPKVTTDKVNNLGIKELVGRGTSLFYGSIPNRIYNLTLASNRLNGILIAPGEVFSFNKAVGDVSSLTGYKQAYVIQNGRTVLGDGGGVCQVSTTFFRAILNSGFPVVERNPHAYRVHYYEDDSGPGIDAAIYTPTVDLKFKNDSGHHLLVQSFVNPEEMSLTFELYGTSDGREVTVNKPVILSQSPAPEPLYQDDPNLPKGQVKQVDFAAPGARVYFTREVRKNGKVIISDKFSSNYRPWQAVFLRGTKEG